MRKRQSEMSRAPPIDVKRTKDGLDFQFIRRQHAQRFVSLLHSLAPCRSKASSSLVAANAKTGTSNVRHTWSVEVAAVCRGDLVHLPRSLTAHASVSRWAIVTGVAGEGTHAQRLPFQPSDCLLPTARCPLPASNCPLPTAHCPLPTARCPLPAARCPMPTAHCPLPASCNPTGQPSLVGTRADST